MRRASPVARPDIRRRARGQMHLHEPKAAQDLAVFPTRMIAGEVRPTLAISCEAVPAVPSRRGHEAAPSAWYSRNEPGAAESLVSFIALFCGA